MSPRRTSSFSAALPSKLCGRKRKARSGSLLAKFTTFETSTHWPAWPDLSLRILPTQRACYRNSRWLFHMPTIASPADTVDITKRTGMVDFFQGYHWFLKTVPYGSEQELLDSLEVNVIAPPEQKANELSAHTERSAHSIASADSAPANSATASVNPGCAITTSDN